MSSGLLRTVHIKLVGIRITIQCLRAATYSKSAQGCPSV